MQPTLFISDDSRYSFCNGITYVFSNFYCLSNKFVPQIDHTRGRANRLQITNINGYRFLFRQALFRQALFRQALFRQALFRQFLFRHAIILDRILCIIIIIIIINDIYRAQTSPRSKYAKSAVARLQLS